MIGTPTQIARAQSAYDNRAEPDFDDIDIEEAAERAPLPLVDVPQTLAGIFAEVDACAAVGMSEAGVLRGMLQIHLGRALQKQNDLLIELQAAVDETCNAYHTAGHAQRVRAAYGIDINGAA